MSSDKNNSEERIRKATEVIQRFWWFCIYLIIFPFLPSLILFYILQLFITDVRVVLSFSILLNLFLILILDLLKINTAFKVGRPDLIGECRVFNTTKHVNFDSFFPPLARKEGYLPLLPE